MAPVLREDDTVELMIFFLKIMLVELIEMNAFIYPDAMLKTTKCGLDSEMFRREGWEMINIFKSPLRIY
jgi:hypothetical protein